MHVARARDSLRLFTRGHRELFPCNVSRRSREKTMCIIQDLHFGLQTDVLVCDYNSCLEVMFSIFNAHLYLIILNCSYFVPQ